MSAAAPDHLDDLSAASPIADGVDMPMLGFGTWQLENGPDCVADVRDALDVGYRHLDTASIYGNEESVGQALRDFGKRDEVFVTTKLWNDDHGTDTTPKALDASLERLGLDHVDLYLIHWPCGTGFGDTWHAMERLLAAGKTRAIGVSNFQTPHLQTLLGLADVRPAVNQVEFHPWLTQPELHQFHRDHGIVSEAWSPLMQGKFNDAPELVKLSKNLGKHPAQVLLRWCLQHGVATIPRSSNRAHIESNADVFNFELTDEQMGTLDALDQHRRLGPDPFEFPKPH